jgi:hypothetical protein
VSAIAREARIHPSQLYGRRRQLRSSLPATAGFAAVRVAGEGPATPGSPGMIDIEFATGTQMSSAPERIRSNHIFNGSTRNGPQAFVNGAELWRRLRCKGSADRRGSSPNGLLAVERRKGRRRKACDRSPRRGASPDC